MESNYVYILRKNNLKNCFNINSVQKELHANFLRTQIPSGFPKLILRDFSSFDKKKILKK